MKESTICALLLLSCNVSAEVFSAVSELEGLLETESLIIQTMEIHIKKVQKKINSLKKDVMALKNENLLALCNKDEYLSNPINAYNLIKRIVVHWERIINTMDSYEIAKETLFKLSEIKSTMAYPTTEDLTGAALSLMRLQDTYDLTTVTLVEGNIKGSQSHKRLTTKDCYEFAMYAFLKEDYYHTRLWIIETLAGLQGKLHDEGVWQWNAMEFLAYSHFKEGNIEEAIKVTEKLLEIFPDHPRAKTNIASMQIMRNESLPINNSTQLTSTEDIKYKMACNRAITPSESLVAKLKCRYDNHNPFLRLAPLKLEEVYNNPKILLFRQILSDEETKMIKDLSQKRLLKAAVENVTTGGSSSSDEIRLSKFGWLTSDDGKMIEQIMKRVEDATSLTTETAETIQVVNYGIGGHYSVHEDYAKVENSKITSLGTGNRIATILFYLSDVPQGGATVFPHLQLSIQPDKGTALFWYNLLPDGQGDPLSRHAACPTLIGSKWVATVWLHERGQEFRRLCDLDINVPAELNY